MNAKFEQGLAIRKDVLGAEHVERSLANATDFDRPMQELSTEWCWGTVWARKGLSRKERSMINLAMLSALNRPDELALHTKGAIRNGCTPEEITEIFMQVAIYCGVPAAMESFKVGKRAIQELQETSTT
ncbi:4-carboxymuconolactone decarboxylase [Alicyclobacillus acidoterrestris]|uniref:carboxymuconolactone decarboxylase family protein n=1 Tax=Alicyclobacillus suci TaxID=2816080 RepID=UPI001194A58F|nr:carboxymuconolactone decarboxylase family protein [Alicyclobacillus suci]GEO26435.1 4-carboxymuconolactone decarboxylase [Alicyclobacillus acidoterrestris]